MLHRRHTGVGLGPAGSAGGRRCLADVLRAADRDRILHSTAFRRVAGKTQVFIFPADHEGTELTHALEVAAQVARAIAAACRLNIALVEAIALGHDCGHGPGGHASEDALGTFVPGFDHAVCGAGVTAAPLNLCGGTLDGIRNHSWFATGPGHPRRSGRGPG